MTPTLNNLNNKQILEYKSEMERLGLVDETLHYALASAIIGHAFGGDFWSKECTTYGEKQEFFLDKSDVRLIHVSHMI